VLLDLDAIFDPDQTARPRPIGAPVEVKRHSTVGRRHPLLLPSDLPIEWHIAWDERAAIMEYDGGLVRERAEAEALKLILEEMQLQQ